MKKLVTAIVLTSLFMLSVTSLTSANSPDTFSVWKANDIFSGNDKVELVRSQDLLEPDSDTDPTESEIEQSAPPEDAGIWRSHGFESGKAWGKAVSKMAKSYPGAVSDHIKEGREEIDPESLDDEGIWRSCGFESGQAWGKAISELAQSYPGAVADYMAEICGGN
jgi:hypothetical protein